MRDKVKIIEWFYSGIEWELHAFDPITNLYTVSNWEINPIHYPKVCREIIELI